MAELQPSNDKPPRRDIGTELIAAGDTNVDRFVRWVMESRGKHWRKFIEAVAKLFELILLSGAFQVAGKIGHSGILYGVGIFVQLLAAWYALSFFQPVYQRMFRWGRAAYLAALLTLLLAQYVVNTWIIKSAVDTIVAQQSKSEVPEARSSESAPASASAGVHR